MCKVHQSEQDRHDNSKSNIAIIVTCDFVWYMYMVRCGHKIGHQKKTCVLKLRAQNMLNSLGSKVNIRGDMEGQVGGLQDHLTSMKILSHIDNE